MNKLFLDKALVSGILGGAITGATLVWLQPDMIREPAQPIASVQPTAQPISPSRFTVRDRLGGIGLFGTLVAISVLAAGETALGIFIITISAPPLFYALVAGKRA